jgi:integrase
VETGGVGLVVQHQHENKDAEHGFPPLSGLADTLRKHLKRAGVTRRALHTGSATSKRLTFHDLRASGTSWLPMLPTWTQFDVRDYAGHSEVSTTDLYVRRGRKARDVVSTPFAPLWASATAPCIGL